MKKSIILLIIALVAVAAVVCIFVFGGKDTPSTVNGDPTVGGGDPTPTEAPTKGNEESTDKNEIELIYTFEDPSKPVVFDYPNMRVIEEGTSRVFANSKFVVVYCRDAKQAALNDILGELSGKFKSATRTHLEAFFDSYSLTKTETKRINQTDVLLVEGVIVAKYSSGDTIQLPMRGYTFAKGDAICQLVAILNEEENAADQAEMEKTIDAMIATLRETK